MDRTTFLSTGQAFSFVQRQRWKTRILSQLLGKRQRRCDTDILFHSSHLEWDFSSAVGQYHSRTEWRTGPTTYHFHGPFTWKGMALRELLCSEANYYLTICARLSFMLYLRPLIVGFTLTLSSCAEEVMRSVPGTYFIASEDAWYHWMDFKTWPTNPSFVKFIAGAIPSEPSYITG